MFSQAKEKALRSLNLKALVRETGLEPASAYCTHEPESCASANSAIPAWMVGRGGFEPPKRVAADLQSAPFGHSGTYPYYGLPS